MLDKTDIDKIEKINSDLKSVHKSFTSRDSKCYEHYMKLLDCAMKDRSLTRTNKELIAVGISAYAYCEPCITLHIREALRGGATDDQVIEAVEVAIEMGEAPWLREGRITRSRSSNITGAKANKAAVPIAIAGPPVRLAVMPAYINVLTRYASWNKISGH